MKINSFQGIHNTVPRQDIPKGACADAVDVDITGQGTQYEHNAVIARNGYALAKIVSTTATYTSGERVSYAVSNGVLHRVKDDLSFSPLIASTATEFCDSKGVLFTNIGQMIVGGTAIDLHVPQPFIPPQVVVTGGSREPGFYSCAYTYSSASGLEGGMSPITFVELKEKGDVLVTPIDRPGFTTSVYIAPEDGSVFFDRRGTPLTQYCIGTGEFPNDVVSLDILNSKLYTAHQHGEFSVIRYSKPFHYHLFDYEKDYALIADRVTYIRAVGNTLIICGTNGIYTLDDSGLNKLADYGAVPGRAVIRLPDTPEGPSTTAFIHTVRGVCAALPFTPLTAGHVSLPMGSKCATAIVNQNGVNKFVGLHDGGGTAFNPAF